MNLYRLDFHNGHELTAVRRITGDYLTRCYATAVAVASDESVQAGQPVVITRIGRAGHLRPMLRVLPDGTRKRIP
jgi:hypothetical protein